MQKQVKHLQQGLEQAQKQLQSATNCMETALQEKKAASRKYKKLVKQWDKYKAVDETKDLERKEALQEAKKRTGEVNVIMADDTKASKKIKMDGCGNAKTGKKPKRKDTGSNHNELSNDDWRQIKGMMKAATKKIAIKKKAVVQQSISKPRWKQPHPAPWVPTNDLQLVIASETAAFQVNKKSREMNGSVLLALYWIPMNSKSARCVECQNSDIMESLRDDGLIAVTSSSYTALFKRSTTTVVYLVIQAPLELRPYNIVTCWLSI